MIPIPIDFILIGIVSLIIVLISIYLYLVYKKRVQNIEHVRKEAYLESYLADWDRFFRNEIELHDGMIPKHIIEINAVEEILLTYINNFASEHIIEKIKHFANEHLRSHYQSLLKTNSWSIRMNTLNRAIDFHLDSLLADYKKLEQKKLSSEEYFLLLSIYSKMDANHFLKTIEKIDEEFSENEYKKLLENLDLDSLKVLVERFSHLSSNFQYALFSVIGMKGATDLLPFLDDKLEEKDDEIRIRALKAINEIGLVTNWEKYLGFIDSPIWEERLMVTKLLRHAPIDLALPYLEKSLKDEAWWIRSEAADIIYQDKHGEEILQRIIEVTNDQFAIDMAKEYIHRSSLS